MGRTQTHLLQPVQPIAGAVNSAHHIFHHVHDGSYGHVLPSPPKPKHHITPLRLEEDREECYLSTREQCQRQRLSEQQHRQQQQHHTAVVAQTIPGYRTSAAFFASLRTNLRLHASPPPSPVSTPPSMRGSTTSLLPPPSPLSQAAGIMDDNDPTTITDIAPAAAEEDPLADVPELTTYLTTSDDDRVAGLKLIADSIAQQRQTANTHLIWHPLNLPVAIAIISVLGRYTYTFQHDILLALMTSTGFIMAMLAALRYITKDYLFAAEEINREWLGAEDEMWVTKFGDEVIGTVVVAWERAQQKRGKKAGWRGEVRAWTVRMKYRGKGVGRALLEEPVAEARKRGAEGLEFAEGHANSKRVLPNFYNAPFDTRDRKARELLDDLMQSSSKRGKRKSH